MEVARSAIHARIIVLDFTVIKRAYLIPSLEASKDPNEKSVSPGNVKGRNNHKRRIKPLIIRRRLATFFIFNREITIKKIEKNMAVDRGSSLSEMATTVENKKAITILTLGSRR